MSRPRRSTPPPESIANARLTEFVRTHRRTLEDWTISDTHSPGWGSRDCGVCHAQWPCQPYREMATRLGWDGGWPWLGA